MTPVFRRSKTLLLLTCIVGCHQIATAQNTPTPASDAAGVAAFKKSIGPEEFQKLQGRLMELNHDIVTRGILPFMGSSDKLLTGYAYNEFYDWDLYFENLYLSYYGISNYCFNNFKAFMAIQHPDGFIPRMLKRQNIQMFKPFLAQIAILGSKQRNGDYEWLRATYYDQLKRYLNRWFAYDKDSNGLPVWDSSDASGMDNQTRRAGGMHDYNCEGTDLACYLHRELVCMAFIAGKLGKPEDLAAYQKHADALAQTINTVLWDDKDGFYYDWNEKTGAPIKIKSVAGFLPLWEGIASPEQARRLVQEHLLNPNEFWLKYPIATYAATEPDFYEGRHGTECNWHGTAWIPTNYMVFHGLLCYGFKNVARDLAYRTFKMALDENPVTREYYDSDTGKGNGMNPFWGWSSLAYVMPLEYETGYNPTALNAEIKPTLVEDLRILMPK